MHVEGDKGPVGREAPRRVAYGPRRGFPIRPQAQGSSFDYGINEDEGAGTHFNKALEMVCITGG